MTDFSSVRIPQPKDWQAFERGCRILFECILDDPGVQLNGRAGQQQHGVDVFGIEKPTGNWWGIQCKERKAGSKRSLTERELRTEAEKARRFSPPLRHFVVVTTASDDQEIQRVARQITEEYGMEGVPLKVSVWGWETIEDRISQHPRALKAFHPDATPNTDEILSRLSSIQQELTAGREATLGAIFSASTDASSSSQESLDKHIHKQIDEYRDYIEANKPRTALELLDKLKAQIWDSASSKVRFRLLTNMASAKLRMGKEKEAAIQFFQAEAFQPNDAKAVTNVALAHLLQGSTAESKRAASKALAMDEGNADAASFLIQASIDDQDVTNPLDLVPEKVRETVPVEVARIHFFRVRGDVLWKEYARSALERHPDDPHVRRYAAEAALDTLLNAKGSVWGVKNNLANRQDLIRTTIGTLSELWAEQRNGDAPEIDSALPHNLIQAYVTGDDFGSAEEVARQARKAMPDDVQLAKDFAMLAARQGKEADALSALASCTADPECLLMAAEINLRSAPEESLKILDGLEKLPDLDERHRYDARCLRVGALLRSTARPFEERVFEANRVVQGLECAYLESAILKVLRSDVANTSGDREGSIQALKEAAVLLSGDTPFEERFMLAQRFEAFGLDADCADTLGGHVDPNQDSPPLQLLLESLVRSDRRKQARELLDHIPQKIVQQVRYQRAAYYLHMRRGDYPAAEVAAQRLVALSPENLGPHLDLVDLCVRRGDDVGAREILASAVENLLGSPREKMQLARVLYYYGFDERAHALGYVIMLANRNDLDIRKDYMKLLLQPKIYASFDPEPKAVEANTAFTVVNRAGKERSVLIEPDPTLRLIPEAIGPTHQMAKAALGRGVGEEFEVTSDKWRITSIKHKYLYPLHETLESLDLYFPEGTEVRGFRVEPGSENPLESALDFLRRAQSSREQVLRDYAQEMLPLEFTAKLLGIHVIDLWYQLPGVNVPFKVSLGSEQERSAAFRAIDTNGMAGCVVDALTLKVILDLKIGGAVRSVCGPIFSTQSEIDSFRVRREEYVSRTHQPYRIMHLEGEQPVLEEISQDRVQTVISTIDSDLAWIAQNVKTLPAESAAGLPAGADAFQSEVSPDFFDPLLAWQDSRLLLLSEDQVYRQIGISLFSGISTWLQPVLMMARRQGAITQQEYGKAIIELVRRGHRFTSLDASVLQVAARDEKGSFRAVSKALFEKEADLSSHIDVMVQFLRLNWTSEHPSPQVMSATSALLNRYCYGEWLERYSDTDARELSALLHAVLRNHPLSRFVRNWAMGHVRTRLGWP